MFEWLRKITAAYTEEEYNEWLEESPIDFRDKEDIGEALMYVSEDTGYEPEFLGEILYDILKEGEQVKEAFRFTVAVSYEQDW